MITIILEKEIQEREDRIYKLELQGFRKIAIDGDSIVLQKI